MRLDRGASANTSNLAAAGLPEGMGGEVGASRLAAGGHDQDSGLGAKNALPGRPPAPTRRLFGQSTDRAAARRTTSPWSAPQRRRLDGLSTDRARYRTTALGSCLRGGPRSPPISS